MTLKQYVSRLRDEFFDGAGKAIYLNSPKDLGEFIEESPEAIEDFGVPSRGEMEFPIAIIFDEDRAFWVDSSGNLWSCGPRFCRFIISKEWLP